MANYRAPNSSEGRSETATVRLSARLRFFTELAATAQGMSLSNYIEQLLEADWPNVPLPDEVQDDTAVMHVAGKDRLGETYVLADIADAIWADDDAARFLKQYSFQWTFSSEQRRMHELLTLAPALRQTENLAKHWNGLMQLQNYGETNDAELLTLLGDLDWKFVLMTERKRVALYKADRDEFLLRANAIQQARKRINYEKRGRNAGNDQRQ